MSPTDVDTVIQEICPLITAGEASLLLGAGFTYKNPSKHSELPTGDGLRNILLTACGQTPGPNTNLRDAYKFAKRNLPDFENFLVNCFTVEKVYPWQEKIFQYVWNRIYTTNIDNVLDVGYENTKKKGQHAADFTSLNYIDNGIVGQTLGSVPVINIHGTILRPQDGFIFSNTEYGQASSRKVLDWHNDLAARMMMGGLIVIGNQLDESDFDTHLAARIAEYGESTSTARNWIVMPDPDPIKMDNYIAAGYHVINSTAEEFLNLVYANVKPRSIGEIIAETVPTSRSLVRSQKAMTWFKEAFTPVISEIEKAKSERGLLRHFITGAYPRWFYIQNEAHATTPKIVSLTRKINSMMTEGKDEYGILHVIGPSGSGKTTGIRASLRNLSSVYPYVYEYDSDNGLDITHLHKIIQGFSEKAIIIFHSAAAFYYSINALAVAMQDNRRPYTLFILEERTNSYRKNRHHLSECSHMAAEFEFGRVSFGDAKEIALKIQELGLRFDSFSDQTIDKQAKLILNSERGYHGDLLSTLFSLTTHENFEDKIYREYHSITDPTARSILDLIAVMNTLGFNVPMNYLAGFLSLDQRQITEYLNTDLSDVAIPLAPKFNLICRHRVIADFYFKSCIGRHGKVDVIVGVLEFLSRQFAISDIRFHPLAYEMYKNIISFSFLYDRFFPTDTRKDDTERVYHEAQRFFGSDGIFWLQFGRFYRKTDRLDDAIECFRTGLSYYYDSFQTQHSLGTALLEKYLKEGCKDVTLYDEGVTILEREKVRRGPLDPYPTTSLCLLLLKIVRKMPTNSGAYDKFVSNLTYGMKHFKEDRAFQDIVKDHYSRRKNPR